MWNHGKALSAASHTLEPMTPGRMLVAAEMAHEEAQRNCWDEDGCNSLWEEILLDRFVTMRKVSGATHMPYRAAP